MKKNVFVVIFLVLFCVSCASRAYVIKNADLIGGEKRTVNLLNEPVDSIGVLETEELKRGDVTIVQGVFPEDLFGEIRPGKISYNGWAVSPAGIEYFAQCIFAGINYSGHFNFVIIIHGKDGPNMDEVRVTPLSAKVSNLFDLAGNRYPIESRLFIKNKDGYRKKEVLEKGTRVGDLKRIPEFLKSINSWNRFETIHGNIWTPLSKERVQQASAINPKHSFTEKLFLTKGNGTLSADVIGTSAGIAFDTYDSLKAKDQGWCFECEVVTTGSDLTYMIRYPLDMKQRLINQINRNNYQKLKNRE